MAVTAFATGSLTASATTEFFLSSPTSSGVYTLNVDLAGMATGDVLYLRAYRRTGGTATAPRVAMFHAVYGAQATNDYELISAPISNPSNASGALRWSLQQPLGSTARVYDWELVRHI